VRLRSWLAPLLLVAACCHPTTTGPVNTPASGATCADMCKHLADLHCKSAEPTPDGASCPEVCENIRSAGVVPLNLECRVRAPSCEAADSCQ